MKRKADVMLEPYTVLTKTIKKWNKTLINAAFFLLVERIGKQRPNIYTTKHAT